ncbi:MAG TPA: hypothetical protein VF283_05350 [Bryobacteraceae bacterium]
MSMRILATLLFFACSCLAHDCPWMNTATASDLLGGSVTAAATKNTCSFTLQQSGAVKSIHIRVRPLPIMGIRKYRKRCRNTAIPVNGLGNEAFACRAKSPHKATVERLAGRVRQHAFIVDVSTSKPHANRTKLIYIAKETAGQVAGNLF